MSWNRLVVAVGGPAIELGAVGRLAGLVIASSILWVVRVRQCHPPNSWLLAACITWGLFTVQARGYELVLLSLTVPYLVRLHDCRRYGDLVFLLALIAVMSIPRSVVLAFGTTVGADAFLPLILSYRAIALACLAGFLLLRKP